MIDIENEIFSIISEKLRAKYQGIYISGEYVKSPPSFPSVSLIEMDNEIYRSTRTNESIENHVQVMYEINVYSNKIKGKKTEAKSIMSVIDSEFERLGFTRIMYTPIPNELDATIYRIVARYRAVVSKDKVIYRR